MCVCVGGGGLEGREAKESVGGAGGERERLTDSQLPALLWLNIKGQMGFHAA